LALQRTVTVTEPSEAVPDDGETVIHESELLTVQSRLAVKVTEPLLPSALSSMLGGPESINSGAFWHAQSATASKNDTNNNLFIGA
jgi:hypothetical protein